VRVVLSAVARLRFIDIDGCFLALGGTLGSKSCGYLFKNEGPENAFLLH
jgi:hypothetical protein